MITFDNIIFLETFRYFFILQVSFIFLLRFSLLNGWRLRVLQTTLDILRPITNIFIGIEDQIHRAGHVMFALALTHIVHRAIILIRMIRYMIVFLVTKHFICCKIYFKIKKIFYNYFDLSFFVSLSVT